MHPSRRKLDKGFIIALSLPSQKTSPSYIQLQDYSKYRIVKLDDLELHLSGCLVSNEMENDAFGLRARACHSF
ncbi:hypothetical protein MUK42_04277 [Musa troglodytarum]|uniref:Uncharacterized protein n=1 Tax=Musa troglodytarum TaxID=320322 RepID=A0A9E7G0D3_9LILI|nr:hypothetical protein MUK42_04277 [Musa troglodytarum]